MNKRHVKKILILAIILLFLSLALYLQSLQKTKRHSEDGKKMERTANSGSFRKVLAVLPDTEKIERIVIEHAKGQRLELSLSEDPKSTLYWQLDSPEALSVREGSIRALAQSVLALRGKALGGAFDLRKKISQERYGFGEKTWLRVDLFVRSPNQSKNQANNQTKDDAENFELLGRVLLGGKVPGIGGRYVAIESKESEQNTEHLLYRISEQEVERLGVRPNDLRNRFLPKLSLLSNQQEHLQTLEIRSYSNVMRIEFKTEELAQRYSSLNELQNFVMTKPYPVVYGVAQYELEQLLQNLPNPIEILDYRDDAPEDLGQYGLAKGQRQELYAEDSSGRSLALWVGKEADRETVFAKQPDYDSVFTIGKELLSAFNFEPFKIVDKFVILLNIERVDRIQLQTQEGPGYSVKIRHQAGEASQKIAGGGLFQGTSLRSLDSDLTKDLYQEFLGILFVGQVPDSFFPVDKAKVSMIYSLRDGKTRRADFYNYSAKDYYVVSMDGGKATFVVERRALNGLQQALTRVLKTGQLDIVQ